MLACLLVLLGWVQSIPRADLNPALPVVEPIFFEMDEDYLGVAHRQVVFSFPGKDSLVEHTMELLSDGQGQPLFFYADILTPVCIDNICKPMAIAIYWNLTGDYVGYGLHPEEPLTKYDHELFEQADYEKLHALLRNPHSILERRKLEDLFDPEAVSAKQVTYKGEEVDAVSGATRKEITESVVEGALYSCYTIWHLVHGEVRKKMAAQLEAMYSPALGSRFLGSPYTEYQMYALRHFERSDMAAHLPRIIELFETTPPVTRRYILKKLPDSVWASDTLCLDLFRRFSELDINSQTLLVELLPHAPVEAAVYLATQAGSMTKNQLTRYLDFLRELPDGEEKEGIQDILRRMVAQGDYPYSYLIEDYLNAGGR